MLTDDNDAYGDLDKSNLKFICEQFLRYVTGQSEVCLGRRIAAMNWSQENCPIDNHRREPVRFPRPASDGDGDSAEFSYCEPVCFFTSGQVLFMFIYVRRSGKLCKNFWAKCRKC